MADGFRVTEASDSRLTEAGDVRITEHVNLGACSVSGAGTMVVAAARRAHGAVALSGTGSAIVAALKPRHAAAALSGAGTCGPRGHRRVPGASAISASGGAILNGHAVFHGAFMTRMTTDRITEAGDIRITEASDIRIADDPADSATGGTLTSAGTRAAWDGSVYARHGGTWQQPEITAKFAANWIGIAGGYTKLDGNWKRIA